MNDFSPGLILAHHNSYPFPSTSWRTHSSSRVSGLHCRVSFFHPLALTQSVMLQKSEKDKKRGKSNTGNGSKEYIWAGKLLLAKRNLLLLKFSGTQRNSNG